MAANSSVSDLTGNCVAPFLDASKFGGGGFVSGRFCAVIDGLAGNPSCCLPCPATDWAYSAKFHTYNVVSAWLNVAGLILLVFMLVSYILLPAHETRKHYLSVSLVIALAMIALGFTIPLGANPDQCYDEITPNDMYTSMECAWSGAFIIAGGLTAGMWIFLRALSMNLQICWDIVPGRKFFYASQMVGWGIPAIFFTITITITGVSFRFGSACHVNHKNSMGDFWGPLLAMAGGAAMLQIGTFGYCIHVYLKNLWSDQPDTSTNASSNGGTSRVGSVRAQTARAVYRRLKKVLWLQWRGICIVSIILIDVIFFSIVFVYLDGMQQSAVNDLVKVTPWLLCLARNPSDKDMCLHLVDGWLVNESVVAAVLFMLALAGLQAFLMLTRPTVFTAWADFIRSKFTHRRQEFVSLDAKPEIVRSNSKHELLRLQRGHQATTFEMQGKPDHVITMDELDLKTFSPINTPDESYRSPIHGYRDSPSLDESEPWDSSQTVSPHLPTLQGQSLPQYVGRRTPSLAENRPPNPAAAGYHPRPDVQRIVRHDDCFVQDTRVSRSEGRRYNAPTSNFSAPNAPSRTSSTKSVSFEPREYYSHDLTLSPPSEAGETEDVSSQGFPIRRNFGMR
ncbi:hypothetical protein DOTSEDRAFT_71900 [Dothistroma septosporum NZE10]|uniref:G-protein coupled receptors family 2 profile 2 domain-containing protein n=1 Tax=Dothistroma septosporum (strain NZE10 / CBS 128990) TaxID=675120 RepID=N1PMS2_DOTSN|nr:hypothetical protein DOTSEDRAFT_71900 [Dothistroma septosporum NZE10]